MNKALKYGLFLCILGIIVGCLLALVNYVTKDRIAAIEQEKVFSVLNEFDDSSEWADVSANLNDGITAIYKNNDNVYAYKTLTYGYGNGEMVVITFIKDNEIKKVMIVSTSGQTKGVGSQVEDASYLNVFTDKNISEYANKSAMDHSNKDVDVISGATYSSRSIVDAVILASTHYGSEVQNNG